MAFLQSPLSASAPSSVTSIFILLEVISRNLPEAPAQIPPMVKLSGTPSLTVMALLSIPPMSMMVASPLCLSASQTAPLELTVSSSWTSFALKWSPRVNLPYPVVPMASMSFSSTPAIFMAFSRTWVADLTTSPDGVQSFPMILLSCMMTAFVVEEPESSPAVRPVCLSLARSSFLVTMVTRASILVSSWDALSLSVKE